MTALATGPPVTGGMAEWTIAAVLKTAVRATVPWVRIPLPPPIAILSCHPSRSITVSFSPSPPVIPLSSGYPGVWGRPISSLAIPHSSWCESWGEKWPSRLDSAVPVRNVKTPGRSPAGDTLYLMVWPSARKSWVQRLTIEGKRKDLGLGPYPTVSLAQARERAQDNPLGSEVRRQPVRGEAGGGEAFGRPYL